MQHKHVAGIISGIILCRTGFDCKDSSRVLAFIHKFRLWNEVLKSGVPSPEMFPWPTKYRQHFLCPVSSKGHIKGHINGYNFISFTASSILSVKIMPHRWTHQILAGGQAFMLLISQQLQDNFRERHTEFDCHADTSSVFLSTSCHN